MSLLINEFSYLLDKFFLCTLSVAVVLSHDVALAVANDYVRNGLDAECALEVAVGIEEHLILPAVVVNEGLHLINILCLVDGHCDDLYAGLLLPVLIHLA